MLQRTVKTILLVIVLTGSIFACNDINAQTLSPDATNDLWSSIRDSFVLPDQSSRPDVQAQIKWYIHHQDYLRLVAGRAGPYLYYIHQQVDERGIAGELSLLPMIESAYNPFAYSKTGAAGLWQIMPDTGSGFGLKQDWWYDGRRDVYRSTNAALHYLTYLHKYFNGDWYLAMAAYDSGEGTVQNAVQRNVRLGKPTDFWSLSLPKETEAYVPRLLALASIIRHPGRYPVQLPEIDNKPYFAQVDVGSQIDLAHAAKLANMKLATLYKLNPAYNRWATDPNGPFTLVLPIKKVDLFKRNLADLPTEERITWNHHVIQDGETLGNIADQYGTSVRLIKRVNKLSIDDPTINVGDTLLIPRSTAKLERNGHITKQSLMANKTPLGKLRGVEDNNNNNTDDAKKIIHIVQVGDSVWKLSKKYHIDEASIRSWNHLASNKPLEVGSQLMIWSPIIFHAKNIHHHASAKIVITNTVINSDKSIPATSKKIKINNQTTVTKIEKNKKSRVAKTEKSKHTPSERWVKYVIKNGDSLDKIAHHHHVKVSSLKRWNKIARNSFLKEGRHLMIYEKIG